MLHINSACFVYDGYFHHLEKYIKMDGILFELQLSKKQPANVEIP